MTTSSCCRLSSCFFLARSENVQYPDLNNVQWEYSVETEEGNVEPPAKRIKSCDYEGDDGEPPAKRIKTSDYKVICDIPLLAQGLDACK